RGKSLVARPELAPAASATTAAASGRGLLLHDLARGRDDVPLAAVQVEVPTLGLACGRVAGIGVERPVVVRHDLAAGRILVRPQQRSLRGAAGRRLARPLPLQRRPEARARTG